MELLKLPMEKLKNKVICDKHFPETSFMNYTRSKLNKTTAIPTLFFSSDNVEIDLLTNPTEWVYHNRNETPSSEFLTSLKTDINIDESSDQITVTNSSLTPPPIKRIKVEKQLLPTPKAKISEIRILNKIPTASPISNSQVVSVKSTPPAKFINAKVKVEKPKAFSPPTIINNSPPPKVDNEQYEYIVLPSMSSPPASTVNTVQADSSLEVKSIMKDLTEIKSLLNEKLQQQASPTPAQSPSTSSPSESNITQSHLNKIQLFNGIKRYLSPSLIALLRMEIFAAPSREYKKDEKIICSEILKLGNETYDFFSDEWRLRLPSKEMVKGWQSEEMTDDDAS
jgi:hypothetical protein